ncbi:MAG: hypothetical protein ACKO4T_01080 [Planctomycetaceae bacterium]
MPNLRGLTIVALVMPIAALAGAAEVGSTGILPPPTGSWPAAAELATGPLRVRFFPGQQSPSLQHYMNLESAASVTNLVAAVDECGVPGSWAVMSVPSVEMLTRLAETERPLCCYFAMQPVQTHALAMHPATRQAMEEVRRLQGAFFTFGVCEWENAFYRHWQPETDTSAVFGVTPAELRGMSRAEIHEVVVRTARRWKESVGGRMTMANGYGMLSHLAEIGLDAVGVETSETIPATQVKRAFARGAARQFGIPWFEEVSVWFGASVSGGMPEATILPFWPDTPVGGEAGHSASHLRRHWFTAWFSGASHVMLEASPRVLFEVPWTGEFPAAARLSRYGREARHLADLMARVDLGTPYTPFAVLVGRHHGRWSVWGRPWGRLEPTIGDAMMERFFDQVFPGQSQGPGREERYLCSSPFGDTFDVVVNDADRSSWHAYPVILAVGDIAWTAEDVDFLVNHAASGGIVVLNEIHVEGWGRETLGLAAESFQPTAEARVAVASDDGQARVIRRDVGRGCLMVCRAEGGSGSPDTAFPELLLVELAERCLPFRVRGDVQTLVNRTPDGWAVMIVNNKGITKDLHVDRPPAIDASSAQPVEIVFRGRPAAVTDIVTGESIPAGLDGMAIRFILPPGELRIVAVEE